MFKFDSCPRRKTNTLLNVVSAGYSPLQSIFGNMMYVSQ